MRSTADLPGAVPTLVACLANKTTTCWTRAYAARGLCWRHDLRGLQAAAALLAKKDHPEHEFGVLEGLTAAQESLHEFVADIDRPDYVPFDRGEEGLAVEVGQQWLQWLAKKAGKVSWRDARQDANELLFWY